MLKIIRYILLILIFLLRIASWFLLTLFSTMLLLAIVNAINGKIAMANLINMIFYQKPIFYILLFILAITLINYEKIFIFIIIKKDRKAYLNWLERENIKTKTLNKINKAILNLKKENKIIIPKESSSDYTILIFQLGYFKPPNQELLKTSHELIYKTDDELEDTINKVINYAIKNNMVITHLEIENHFVKSK